MCPVCGELISAGQASYHLLCKNCKYEKSRFKPAINSIEAHKRVDEILREKALCELRQRNFRALVNKLKELQANKRARLLDVGAGHGWFLDAASRDFDVMGVEPDERVFAAAKSQGRSIRFGYFPEALFEDEKFNIIVFNDVIEHVSDIKMVLAACHDRLNTGGLLLLNLPSSRGIFYRVAKFLHRMGFKLYFDRLWQRDMPSPHIHYFNSDNLNRIVSRFGFAEICRGSLPSLRFKGLFTRISYVGSYNFVTSCALYCIIVVMLPFLKLFPSDIIYSIYKKK
ncbi:class I SAM-dependent methyltransferase [Desulfomicrobium escambiense]|uniref:class I SAM-dependent methyltransferase n=1 Tax=Desulfomicrobium escambiense TaxID=29503 RepID=UPI000A0629A5|nr:class I SAM-dependent methyltransferase [Desulfomicrobium escambiense]